MAKNSGESFEQIKREIASSRERVDRDLSGLRYELDFPRKIRRSFRAQTGVWIGAAVLLGVILTFAPRRSKKIYVDPKLSVSAGFSSGRGKKRILESAFALGLLKIAASFLCPVITKFIAQKMRGFSSAPRSSRKW